MVELKKPCSALLLCTLVFICCYVELASGANTLILGGTVRDQAPNTMAHARFPSNYWSYNGWTDNPSLGSCGSANNSNGWPNTDFELPLWMYGTIRTPDAKGGVLYNGEPGLVGGVCNATNGWTNCGRLNPTDFTPQYQYPGRSPFGTVQSPQSFSTWFHDGPTVKNVPYNLTLTQTTGRLYGINGQFFPVDGRGWGDSNQGESNGVNHNFAFCYEIHGSFSYTGGEVFSFTGDDDVWVYLDSRLVIDLGGIHTALSATISLDDMGGLTRGNNYRFDFFYCERHTTASDIQLTTSISIQCTYYDWCGKCEGSGQSCCTVQDIAACTDNNACTNDTCAVLVPPTVGCQYTDITPTCPGNKCYNPSCDPAVGCVQTQIPCNDGKACTLDTCNNGTGCVFSPYPCPGDACHIPKCAEPGGCYIVNQTCDDGDPCTVDTCDNVYGCQHVDYICPQDLCNSAVCVKNVGCQNTTNHCDDNDVCTANICDALTGCHNPVNPCGDPTNLCQIWTCTQASPCSFTNQTCDDGDKCTIDSCDPKTGCSHVPNPCNDNNVCTTDSCVSSNPGDGCQNIVKPCDDNNLCTNNTCDPVHGCLFPVIPCVDTNACTNDTCDALLGCQHINITCTAPDACHNATCDVTSGCVFPQLVCNDNNPCTTDSCNLATGCSYVQQPCNHCLEPDGVTFVTCPPLNGDLCFPVSCDPNSGACNITQAVPCDDNNNCTIDSCKNGVCSNVNRGCTDNNLCTDDKCDIVSGCYFVNRTCDDNNPCTTDSCNAGNGNCINTAVSGFCTVCGTEPCTWTDVCNPKVCINDVCTVQPFSCDDGNLCTDNKCDNTGVNATCYFPQKNCTAVDACHPSTCDLATGLCDTTPFDCSDGNPCTYDNCSVVAGVATCSNPRRGCPASTACAPQQCNDDTGDCDDLPPPSCNDQNACTDDVCVSLTDTAFNCTHSPHDCSTFNTGDQCVPPTCDSVQGCIAAAASVCDDGNFCTDDVCVGPLTCTHNLTAVCDDLNACTNDVCNASMATIDGACSHTNKTCYAPDICHNVTGCNATTGCTFGDILCTSNVTDFCLIPQCDKTAGCITIPKPCLVDDPDCYVGVCDSILAQCSEQQLPDWSTITTKAGGGLTCYAYYNKGQVAGIITGGVIAGIVVAGVVFAAAATVAARKAYLYAQLRQGGMGAAQANPLYTPGATEGVNPLFT